VIFAGFRLQKKACRPFSTKAAVCFAHNFRGVGRENSTLAARNVCFPTYTPPENTDLQFFCASGRKLCEAFDTLNPAKIK